MSTVERPEVRMHPPLIEGQRLDRATFHERYAAMPPETRAELIGGIVYMSSPAGLGHVERNDGGARVPDPLRAVHDGRDGSLQLDDDPRPPRRGSARRDAPHLAGIWRTGPVAGQYLAGGPQLVVEVAHTTRAKGLGPKLREYERAAVREYVVATARPNDVLWHARRGDHLVRVPPGEDGIFRSEVFPGLWIDPAALLCRDLPALFATMDRGLATPEHAALVESSREAQGGIGAHARTFGEPT